MVRGIPTIEQCLRANTYQNVGLIRHESGNPGHRVIKGERID